MLRLQRLVVLGLTPGVFRVSVCCPSFSPRSPTDVCKKVRAEDLGA